MCKAIVASANKERKSMCVLREKKLCNNYVIQEWLQLLRKYKMRFII